MKKKYKAGNSLKDFVILMCAVYGLGWIVLSGTLKDVNTGIGLIVLAIFLLHWCSNLKS
jgi:hypothetical protein